MDELEISGKRYISSRRAGKAHKYHPDYIGQLVRAGKVEGQKIGRAWYVNEDSLTEYLGKEASPHIHGSKDVLKMPAIKESLPEVVEPHASRIQEKEKEQSVEIKVEELKKEIAALVAEKIEKDPEMHHIAVNKVSEQRNESHGGLRYVVDTSPFFPPIQRVPITTAPMWKRDAEAITIIEKKHYSPAKWRIMAVRIGTLLVIGGIFFGLVTLLSAKLSSVTTVEGSQPASARYSF